MLVYVATPKQIDHAFTRWINKTGEEERRIVHQVYRWFMASDQAIPYNTVTGLVSFPLDHWLSMFRTWINQEIQSQPSNAPNIRKWSEQLIALLSSDWGIENKLIVRECLDESEYETNF